MIDRTKAIFLDVDGTLNTTKTAGAWRSLGLPSSLEPELVDRAKRIQEATGAAVVLSSTWRRVEHAGRARTILALEARGWPNAREVFHSCVTPYLGGPRGSEIALFLEEHPEIKKFVVLDDDSDMEGVEEHWLPCSFDFGLQEEHVHEAIRRLGPLQPGQTSFILSES